MSNFDAQLERMKTLMSYGRVDENNNHSNYSLEYKFKAADGKTYGIIKECNKYYIKQAETGKEAIAESYGYLGGFMNKKDYQYDSYANALKQFELKMASINEAQEAKVDYTTLDPWKKEDLVLEATDKMKDEIARQRQIMYNASMIMNESKDYAVKGGAACNTAQPEAETGKKGDEGNKKTTANPEYKGSKVGLDKKAAPFKENPANCKDQLKEDLDTDFDEGLGKGRDPISVGWEMDNQQAVNEEDDEWASKGLPGTPGVGEADTNDNNAPFNKTVNEECKEEDDDVCVDGECDAPETDDAEVEDGDMEMTDDAEMGDESDDDVLDFGDEDFADDEEDMDVDGEDLEGDEEDMDIDENDPEAIRAEIERLQAKLDGMEGEDAELGDEDFDAEGEEEDFADFEDEPMDDTDFEGDGEEGEIDEIGDTRKGQYMLGRLAARKIENDDEEGADEISNYSLDNCSDYDHLKDYGRGLERGLEGSFESFGEDDYDPDRDVFNVDDDLDECGGMNPMMEAKRKKMNSIVESVVRQIVKEEQLHDFGKHPGYRKKPMELPATGEDKNQWGRDWNDESTHNEQPFGEKIGSSDPFTILVNKVTGDVMLTLKGEAFKGGKKKEN